MGESEKKRMFVPFLRSEAGNDLANALQKKTPGPSQGFDSKPTTNEYVFAPPRTKTGYQKDEKGKELLGMLETEEDSLYITGHCFRGLDYLSTKKECNGGGKVVVSDLIEQLEARGLPKGTKCKVKLWACEGAVDDGSKESFAKRFSKAMFGAGYRDCRIFGYHSFVEFQYWEFRDDKSWHKRAYGPSKSKSHEEQISEFIEGLPERPVLAQEKDVSWKRKRVLWEAVLKKNSNKVEQARDALLNPKGSAAQVESNGFFDPAIPPQSIVECVRASTVRVEFRDGKVKEELEAVDS